jgi:hypothetical protein
MANKYTDFQNALVIAIAAGAGKGSDDNSGGDSNDNTLIFGDYLLTIGNGNIVTDYLINNTTKIAVDFCFTTKSPTQQRIFGASGNPIICVYINGGGYYAYNCNSSEDWLSVKDFAAGTRNTITMDIQNGKLYIDTTSYNMTKISGEFTGTGPLCIGGWSASTQKQIHNYNARAKIYSVKVYENEKMVHEYLPAKIGDKIGMYDTIDDAFFEYVQYKSDLENEE